MASANPEDNLRDGAPPWVTLSLVADTIQFVRESTGQELTAAEAVEFVVSLSQLADLIQSQSNHKEPSA
jgi:hypothetical protein